MNYNETLKRAEFAVQILNAAGYDAHIVGGALRVQALGGTTNDIDIAVITTFKEGELLNKDVNILLDRLGFNFKLQHQNSDYTDDSDLFIADWRSGDINLIAYNRSVTPTVRDLVNTFDLSINMFYKENGVLKNDIWLQGIGAVVINPNTKGHNPHLKERIARFKQEYSHLDWSPVDKQLAIEEHMNAIL